MQNDGLIVRGTDRFEVRWPGRVRVGPEHERAVRLTRTAGAGGGAVPVEVFDISKGGLGFRTGVYLPKLTALHLEAFEGALDEGEPVLQLTVCVRRVQMVSAEPTYTIGVSLTDPHGTGADQVRGVLARLAARVRQLPESRAG